jgi:hypothetical protein
MLLLLAILTVGPLRPNPALTPGVVRPLTLRTICTTRWGRDRRAVTTSMKRRVAQAYGVPWSKRWLYEFDHLIPRSIGGADVEANLWPQILDPDARTKDREEVRLHKAVCAGELTLAEAQERMRSWGR